MAMKTATIRVPRRVYTPRSRVRRITAAPSRMKMELTIPSLKGIAASLLFVFMSCMAIFTTYRVLSLSSRVEQLQEKKMSLDLENKELAKEFALLTEPSKLVRLGKELGLRAPDEHEIVTLTE